MRAEHILTLHALKGAPASILFALLLEGGSLGVAELARLTGWSDTSIAAGLRLLLDLGYVQQPTSGAGWTLAQGAALLPLGAGPAAPDPVKANPASLDSPSQDSAAGASLPPGEAPRSEAAPGTGQAPMPKILALLSLKEVNLTKINACYDSDSPPRPPGWTSLPAETRVERILDASAGLYGEPVMGSPRLYRDPERLLAWVAQAYSQRQRLGKPARVVYRSMRLALDPRADCMRRPHDFLPASFLETIGYTPSSPGPAKPGLMEGEDAARWDDPESCAAPGTQILEPCDVPDPSTSLPVRQGLSASDAWEMALRLLEQQMPRGVFRSHVEPTRLACFEAETCRFTLEASSPYLRDWLHSRLESTLLRMLEGICDRPAAVCFAAEGEAAP